MHLAGNRGRPPHTHRRNNVEDAHHPRPLLDDVAVLGMEGERAEVVAGEKRVDLAGNRLVPGEGRRQRGEAVGFTPELAHVEVVHPVAHAGRLGDGRDGDGKRLAIANGAIGGDRLLLRLLVSEVQAALAVDLGPVDPPVVAAGMAQIRVVVVDQNVDLGGMDLDGGIAVATQLGDRERPPGPTAAHLEAHRAVERRGGGKERRNRFAAFDGIAERVGEQSFRHPSTGDLRGSRHARDARHRYPPAVDELAHVEYRHFTDRSTVQPSHANPFGGCRRQVGVIRHRVAEGLTGQCEQRLTLVGRGDTVGDLHGQEP